MKKNINIFILTIFILSNLVTSPIYAYERCSTLRPLNAAVSAAADVLASLSTEEPSIQRDRFDIANYEPINPFLINMLNRFKRTQDILELNGDTFRKLVNPYQIFKGAVFAETAGKHRQALSYRIKHNVALGPGGGGMRYITTSELPSDNTHFKRNPDYPIELELVGVNSMHEANALVDRWVFEETLALSMGMTLKNASVNLKLGGAKGSMLLASVIQRDKKFYLVPLSSASPLDDIMLVARITRDWARQLRLHGIVGIYKDKPAADINTTNNPARPQVNIIAWHADEDQEVLFEQGFYEHSHPVLHERLKIIHDNGIRGNDETHLMGKLYLQAVVDYVKETGIAVEELGTYTSKPVSLGGSEVRAYSTALGMRIVTEHLMKKVYAKDSEHEKPLQGTTCAVQGFGNAGKNAFDLMSEAGSKVVAVSEYGTAIYRAAGLNDVKREILDIVRHTGTIRSCVGKIAGVEIIENPDDLLYLDVDILVLAAKEDVVTGENASRIKARVVSEPANGAINMAADIILAANGIKVFHDSLVSAGGVIVSQYERIQNIKGEHWTEEVIVEMLTKQLCDSADAMYKISQERGVNLRTAGDIYAVQRILDAMDDQKTSSAGVMVYPEITRRLLAGEIQLSSSKGSYSGSQRTLRIMKYIEKQNIYLAGKRVLIPGAGTGALALYAASKGASVIAVEINPTACEDMEYNLRQSGLQDKVQIIQGNIFSTLKAYDRFDYVIAHPPIFRGGYNERQKNLNIYDPNFSFIQGLTSETMFGLINNGGRLILMYPSEYTALNLAQPEEDKYFFNLESKRALLLSKGLALINTAPQDRDNESVIWEITKPIRQPFIDIFTKESIFLAFQAAA